MGRLMSRRRSGAEVVLTPDQPSWAVEARRELRRKGSPLPILGVYRIAGGRHEFVRTPPCPECGGKGCQVCDWFGVAV